MPLRISIDNANDEEKVSVRKDREETKKMKIFKPVSLKMIKDCAVGENDIFELDGETYSEVIFAGRVLAMEEHPTRTTFDINDNSGTIKVTFYHRSENNPPKCLQELDYEENCYVKIFGNLRCFKDVRAVVGMTITKIKDYDELTNHWLQVFIAEAVRKNGVLSSSEAAHGSSSGPLSEEEVRRLVKEVFDKFKIHKSQCRRAEVYAELKKKISERELDDAINYLLEDMQIFEQEKGVYSLF